MRLLVAPEHRVRLASRPAAHALAAPARERFGWTGPVSCIGEANARWIALVERFGEAQDAGAPGEREHRRVYPQPTPEAA